MKINIDALNENELIILNREIVRRLKTMSLNRRRMQLLSFDVGDLVEFDSGVEILSGTIIRLNQKTATIDAEDGRSWRVSPTFLRKVNSERSVSEAQSNLFEFKPNTRNDVS
jgi:hypothetical protein